ncbi:MAG: fdrA domain protein [Thaumarchaeota archaeon]|nr:fdrA domain protein [Nitrososphaerota archaeon]
MSKMIDESTSILGKRLAVINIGVSTFADDLEEQGVKVVRVDWKPPAAGDKEMLELLDKLGY